MRILPIITIGLTSLLLQITVLRQLLSVFSGNELDIGITLSVWLLSVGTGSFIGWRIRYERAFALSFLSVAILSQMTVIFISGIRPLLGYGMGEAISLTATVLTTIMLLLPICLVIGAQFPMAVSHLRMTSAKVYGVEAAAAFAGGMIFTFIISGRVDSFTLLALIAALNILTSFYLLRNKGVLILLLIPILLLFGIPYTGLFSHWKSAAIVKRAESRYGEITVLKIVEQSSIYLSGKLEFSYPDPQSEEMRAHLPMSLHPSPKSVLVIGGSPATMREYLKYGIDRVEFLELDPIMIDLSLDILNPEDRNILRDRRLRIITADARRHIKSHRGDGYDLIILNLPEPSTANINRFYTIEFFREAKGAMREGGVIFMTMPTASGYIGRRMQVANGSIYNSLKVVFSHVEVSSEEYGVIFASDRPIDIDPEVLAGRFAERSVATGWFRDYIIRDAFSPLKVELVKERLNKVDSINTDARPLSYLYNLMLWGEIHGGSALNVLLDMKGWHLALGAALIAIVSAVLALKKRKTVYYSIFTTGYAGMAISMTVILSYQAAYGYVYETFGLLTSTFMIGAAAGAYAGREGKRSISRLILIEVGMISLFISSTLFFRYEPIYYLFTFLCGFMAGAAFAAATLLNIPAPLGGEGESGGKLYGIDLAGSFLGASLTGILMVPLLGIVNTIYFIVLLKAVSLMLLLTLTCGKG